MYRRVQLVKLYQNLPRTVHNISWGVKMIEFPRGVMHSYYGPTERALQFSLQFSLSFELMVRLNIGLVRQLSSRGSFTHNYIKKQAMSKI